MSEDLREQLSEVQSNAEEVSGKVTPYGFEQTLNERFRVTTE